MHVLQLTLLLYSLSHAGRCKKMGTFTHHAYKVNDEHRRPLQVRLRVEVMIPGIHQ